MGEAEGRRGRSPVQGLGPLDRWGRPKAAGGAAPEQHSYNPASSLARVNTASSMGSVSFPVKVFCCDTW